MGQVDPCFIASPFPLWQGARARGRMTTAGLPPSLPLHLFGALEGRQMAGAQRPSSQPGVEGCLGAGAGGQIDIKLHSYLPCLTVPFSGCQEPWDIFCAKSWEPSKKLPNFFSTWPSFILSDGRHSSSRCINATGIWRGDWWERDGLEPHQAPALKAHPSN